LSFKKEIKVSFKKSVIKKGNKSFKRFRFSGVS